MHNRKNPIAMLVALALSARMGGHPGKAKAPQPPTKSRPIKNRKGKTIDVYRGYPRLPYSRYRPHQSTRECLRRIGGGMWEQFKRDDRVRRGLPADKQKGE